MAIYGTLCGMAEPTVYVNEPHPIWSISYLFPQDVAIYGALCGMAALGRKELATCLLRNVAFRELLELVPEVCCLLFDRHVACCAIRPLLRADGNGAKVSCCCCLH